MKVKQKIGTKQLVIATAILIIPGALLAVMAIGAYKKWKKGK